jgi:integral membrane protein (TIGR01906 family)
VVPGRAAGFLIAAATAIVILGASILPFLTPIYIRVEQERSGVEAITGWDSGLVYQVTTSIVGDLLFGGDFGVAVGDTAVLSEPEQGHMRDVRGVFQGFFGLVVIAIAVLAWSSRRARTRDTRAAVWRAIGAGARGLAVALVAAGAFAVLAFDAAFELFHRLFFSAGTYTFDPGTDRLVQLFPEQFWSDTAIAVGAVSITVALLTAWQAGRRAGAGRPAPILAASRARS